MTQTEELSGTDPDAVDATTPLVPVAESNRVVAKPVVRMQPVKRIASTFIPLGGIYYQKEYGI